MCGAREQAGRTATRSGAGHARGVHPPARGVVNKRGVVNREAVGSSLFSARAVEAFRGSVPTAPRSRGTRCCLQLAGWIRIFNWYHATSPLSISSSRRSLLRALATTARQGLVVRRCISAAWLRARLPSWRSPV